MSDPAHLAPLGDGTTQLTPDEAAQLVPTWVRTRGDLNRAEAAAIAAVERQYALRVPQLGTMLDEQWCRNLHGRMLRDVWRWAGKYRLTGKNIGIDAYLIGPSVLQLVRNAAAWFEFDDADDAATRLHHQLVAIHPFPDGNGRHGRLYADLCLRSVGRRPFTWGATLQVSIDEKRRRYYAALRDADLGDLAALKRYVRS